MIQIFYKDKGKISISQSVVFLDELGMDDVIWIDLFSPDGDEKRAVEAFLDLPGRRRETRGRGFPRYLPVLQGPGRGDRVIVPLLRDRDHHLRQHQLPDSRPGRVLDGSCLVHSLRGYHRVHQERAVAQLLGHTAQDTGQQPALSHRLSRPVSIPQAITS